MGFCTTVVRRAVPAFVLAALAGCEQSTPTTFDPEGAAADAAALHGAFDTPLLRSLAFAGAGIDRATGGAEVDGADGTRAGFPARLLASMSRAPGPDLGSGELPPAVAGHTYVIDPESGVYVVSESEAAPPAGARFQLYAIDAATGAPAEPLAPLGYLDVIGEGSSEFRIRIGDATGVRLDYRIEASGSAAESRIRVEGFTAAGDSRADFAFDNGIELIGATSGMMRLSERLALPARGVGLECGSIVMVRTGLPPELELDLMLRGPNGEVGVAGAYAFGGNGTLMVAVNGESYAQVHVAGSDFAITGAADEALAPAAV